MKVLFFGTGDIGLPTLEWLLKSENQLLGVVTQPDKPVGRHMELRPSPMKQAALQAGVSCFQPIRLRDPESIAILSALAPEIIVVMAYGQILPRSILELPTLACLNLHASILPRHRGAAPIQAAIESGDVETGVTVMYMAEGLDTGDILLEKKIRIGRRETGGSLHDKLAWLAPDALRLSMELLRAGCAPRMEQDSSRATYAGKLTREHGEIEWRSSVEVDRKVRAMNPWPSAFTWIPDGEKAKKLKVYSVIQSRISSGGQNSGTVLASERRGILVASGEKAVWLTDVQLEGKRRMRASDFLRGNPIPTGIMLGVHGAP